VGARHGAVARSSLHCSLGARDDPLRGSPSEVIPASVCGRLQPFPVAQSCRICGRGGVVNQVATPIKVAHPSSEVQSRMVAATSI